MDLSSPKKFGKSVSSTIGVIVSKGDKKMSKKNKEPIIPELATDQSRTGDIKINDFDLNRGKIPPLSTIKSQIKQTKTLVNTANTVSIMVEFDRLKIGVNLIEHGNYIGFEDWGLENVTTPEKPPSFLESMSDTQERTRPIIEDENEYDISDLFDDEDNDILSEREDFDIESDEAEELTDTAEMRNIAENNNITNDEPDIFTDRSVKRRIRFDDIRDIVGLNNLYISKGYVVFDMTGKIVADNGVLGSLNRNNIRNTFLEIREFNIVSFDIDRLLEVAQVFLCDVCVDLLLENERQIPRYIDGISSFFPLASNRFRITKYGRHGLQMIPKSKSLPTSFVIYSKGQELNYSIRRSTRATIYTDVIGQEGQELAKRTLRLELKLYRLSSIKKILNVQSAGFGIVRLTDVLNANVPIMLQQIELFCGNPKVLLDRIMWLHDTVTAPQGMTLSEIFIAERFIEILIENNYDLDIARAHIRTEYANASDTELEYFNKLANNRQDILNFLVYFKPKSITIMLDIIRRLQAYYNFSTEAVE